jgi:hypothetical protein
MLKAPIFQKYFEKYSVQEVLFLEGSGECIKTSRFT